MASIPVMTHGTTDGLLTDILNQKERTKIKCGKAHLDGLAVTKPSAMHNIATSVDEVIAID
jgi:hypothetical protein